MAAGQAASHDVDKAATRTGHVVKHAGKKVGHATKSSVEGAGHGTKVVAKDSAKGVKKTGEGIKDAPVNKPASRLSLDSAECPAVRRDGHFSTRGLPCLTGGAA